MTTEINGKIKVIFDEQTFKNNFRKKEFVITTEEQYPQDIKIELTQDKVELINDYKVGDIVKVFINIRGNEYNERYFVNLHGYKIEKQESLISENNPPLPDELVSDKTDNDVSLDDDDLPF